MQEETTKATMTEEQFRAKHARHQVLVGKSVLTRAEAEEHHALHEECWAYVQGIPYVPTVLASDEEIARQRVIADEILRELVEEEMLNDFDAEEMHLLEELRVEWSQ